METIPTNTAIFCGHGFKPRVRQPGTGVDVVGGTVRGADELARLRTAGFVRVLDPRTQGDELTGRLAAHPPGAESHVQFGAALDGSSLVLRTVFWLALAGVPVTSDGFAPSVRKRIDPRLLALMDQVDAAATSEPGARELISLALRRRARQLIPHPLARAEPTVAVLLPPGELPAELQHDLDRQTWPALLRYPASDEDSPAVLRKAIRQGATYCTRMSPRLRYGPHHVADLVDALQHSGAQVAHSPRRFQRWAGATWLEDETTTLEGPADEGLPDGSLWYAVDGARAPRGSDDGYAVHGTGAVPVDDNGADRVKALRLHQSLPAVLHWLSVTPGGSRQAMHQLPQSYFHRAGSDRAGLKAAAPAARANSGNVGAAHPGP